MKLDAVLLSSKIYESACASGVSEQDAVTLAFGVSEMTRSLERLLVLLSDERRYRQMPSTEILLAVSAFVGCAHPAMGPVVEVIAENDALLRTLKSKASQNQDAFSVAGQLAAMVRGKRS